MKTLLPFLLLLLHFSQNIHGQGCLPQGITLSTQSAIDSFPINYPGCTKISGILTIQGDDINNLNGLSQITVIGASLYVQLCPALTSLQGLSNLQAIGTVGPTRSMFITNNPLLTSLDGLEHLTKVDGNMDISQNESLENIQSLSNLKSVGKMCWIQQNTALSNLAGLQNLKSVGEDLIIEELPLLNNLKGLDSLKMIGGTLMIQFNEHLRSLDGLSPELKITQFLFLTLNPELSYCAVEAICHFLKETPENLANCANAPGCTGISDILAHCQVSTGTESLPVEPSFTLFPNPCRDYLSVDLEGSYDLELFDVLGKHLLSISATGSTTLDTSTLPAGRYFLAYRTAKQRGLASFMKE